MFLTLGEQMLDCFIHSYTSRDLIHPRDIHPSTLFRRQLTSCSFFGPSIQAGVYSSSTISFIY